LVAKRRTLHAGCHGNISVCWPSWSLDQDFAGLCSADFQEDNRAQYYFLVPIAPSITQGQQQDPSKIFRLSVFAALHLSPDEPASGRPRNCPEETFS